ncbi:hypothetical protein SAY86_010594 [Trapa natans]|uniref:Membrane protein of ER body-like protein n=1 Tax=Trapa natans TaxID=22666 RepID=A0AAN7LIC6_TRANT|nr:hypothetical protein SAY86_010594 [Trapa natans]
MDDLLRTQDQHALDFLYGFLTINCFYKTYALGTESSHGHQEAEHCDSGFIASKMDLIYKNNVTKKPNGREPLLDNFHETKEHDVEISVFQKASVDDPWDVSVERFQEVLPLVSNEHETLTDVNLLSPRKSYQEDSSISLIEEVELQETEYDVEKVLHKQNTHELFCPNCHSCITRKVILRRKSRRVPRFHHGARGVIGASKKNATESSIEAEDGSPDVAVIAPVNNTPVQAADYNRNDKEPEMFRCLSCFIFFIPTGDGFKLFRIFNKKRDDTSMPEAQDQPAAIATENSFFSFLKWTKKPSLLEGSNALDTKLEKKTQQTFNSAAMNSSLPNQSSPLSTTEDKEEPLAGNGLNLEDAVIKAKPAEVIAPSVNVVVDQTVISIDQKPLKETEKILPAVEYNSKEIVSSFPSGSQSSMSESEVIEANTLSDLSKPVYEKYDAVKGPEEPQKSTGGSVIVTIERAPASQTTPTTDNLTDMENPLQTETRPLLDETRSAGVPRAHDFDILKSIVYGGLIESIVSLGVVSSAAGGGVATLNTLALALANLIGGLFVLFHNMRELKNELPREVTQTDTEEDRYYQLLGRRGKFPLHATVAIMSYLVFGLVSPITYGFSFCQSDDIDYKLAAVATISLLCILFLALGKAHVRSKSYIKTAIYYLIMGFAASGISFLVGELVDKLLEQLGLFKTDSSSAAVLGISSKGMHPA